jgi:hypothetical protein
MYLPFGKAEFLETFAEYNRAFWPVVILLWLATATLLLHSVRAHLLGERNRELNALLAVHWIWSSLIYHGVFFARINPAARLFAVLFLIEGCFFIWFGVVKGRLHYSMELSGIRGAAGVALVLYAIAYPALALLSGLQYPSVPLFAVPCPTTIVTAGLLLACVPRPPILIFVIPTIWCLIGTSAAFLLGIPADWALAIAAAALIIRTTAPDPKPQRHC